MYQAPHRAPALPESSFASRGRFAHVGPCGEVTSRVWGSPLFCLLDTTRSDGSRKLTDLLGRITVALVR